MGSLITMITCYLFLYCYQNTKNFSVDFPKPDSTFNSCSIKNEVPVSFKLIDILAKRGLYYLKNTLINNIVYIYIIFLIELKK